MVVLNVRKDLDIARVALDGFNVAQAVGFSPTGVQTMSAVCGHPVNHRLVVCVRVLNRCLRDLLKSL